jgi:hypothetical protein
MGALYHFSHRCLHSQNPAAAENELAAQFGQGTACDAMLERAWLTHCETGIKVMIEWERHAVLIVPGGLLCICMSAVKTTSL